MLTRVCTLSPLCRVGSQTLCQPVMHRSAASSTQTARTSLDLELDLQASRTRQSRLNAELQTLRELRARMEALRDADATAGAQPRAQPPTPLPVAVLQDQRFHSLLQQAERQVGRPPASQTDTHWQSSYCFIFDLLKGLSNILKLFSSARSASAPCTVNRDALLAPG